MTCGDKIQAPLAHEADVAVGRLYEGGADELDFARHPLIDRLVLLHLSHDPLSSAVQENTSILGVC